MHTGRILNAICICSVFAVSQALAQDHPTITKVVQAANESHKAQSPSASAAKVTSVITSDQQTIKVHLSTDVNAYTLTGWKTTSSDCQTSGNICEEIQIHELAIDLTIEATLNKEDNNNSIYSSLHATGHIHFKGNAKKYWPTNDEYSFDVDRSESISNGPGTIVYSNELQRVRSIDMMLPTGSSFPQIYELTQTYGSVDTLAVRARLPNGWTFTYPYDLYQMYPGVVETMNYSVTYLDADSQDREVFGAATDGESKVVISIQGIGDGVSTDDVDIHIDRDEDGYLQDDATLINGTFTQTFVAPDRFTREGHSEDATTNKREVSLEISIDGATIQCDALYLFKPPVILIHGLWSKPKALDPLANSLRSMYSRDIYRIYYPNDRHFKDNIPIVGTGIGEKIDIMRLAFGIVVHKADLVAHSMGGILANLYVASTTYQDDVNRIITLDTPHNGSEVANFLMHFLYEEMTPKERNILLHSIRYSFFEKVSGSMANGAIEDLQANSEAILAYISSIHNARIPAYSVASVHSGARPSLTLDLVYGGLFHMGLWYWDRRFKSRCKREYYFDGSAFPFGSRGSYSPLKVEYGLFHNQSSISDFIVTLESQRGGTTSSVPLMATDHTTVTNDPTVINEIANLLNRPVDQFDAGGFLPRTDYPNAMVGPVTPSTIEYLGCPVVGSKQDNVKNAEITIVTPREGQVFAPGDSVYVRVAYSGEISSEGISFLTQDGKYGEDQTLPYEFDFKIDDGFVGSLMIVAYAAYDSSSSSEPVEDGINIDVITHDAPASVEILPPSPLTLATGAQFPLYVEASYNAPGGSVVREITYVSSTRYSSSDPTIATVSNDGVVTTHSGGETTITVQNDNVSSTMRILVDPSISTDIPESGISTIPQAPRILQQNYPNPFALSTNLQYSVLAPSEIVITVYNVLGQKVCTLVNAHIAPGMYEVAWDGRDSSGHSVSSGVYFYRIRAGRYTEARTMLYLK